jgi:Fibronectin type III domain
MTQTTLWQDVSTYGQMAIKIVQVSQDFSFNTSLVRVEGLLKNIGPNTVTHAVKNIGHWIGGDGGYNDGAFSIDLKPGDVMTYVSQTFMLQHDSNGYRTVHFSTGYGVTNLDRFPNNESMTTGLVLDRIPQNPSKPGQPQFSDEAPTKVTVTWTPPADDGGSAITNYILSRYEGASASGYHLDYSGNRLIRHLTDLDPGKTYTFRVVASNYDPSSSILLRSGISPPSDPNTITTLAGVWVQHGGRWKKAIPYIRHNGKWKQAIPYVRSGGVWKRTS